MQVSFKGILRAYIPSMSATHVEIKDRYNKAKHVENVLNSIDDETSPYSEKEKNRIRVMFKKAVPDYNTSSDENPKIWRLNTQDGIYYITGGDIAKFQNKKLQLQNSSMSEDMKKAEMKYFIKNQERISDVGFFIMDSQKGDRFDIFGAGESTKKNNEKTFDVDFLNLPYNMVE